MIKNIILIYKNHVQLEAIVENVYGTCLHDAISNFPLMSTFHFNHVLFSFFLSGCLQVCSDVLPILSPALATTAQTFF